MSDSRVETEGWVRGGEDGRMKTLLWKRGVEG